MTSYPDGLLLRAALLGDDLRDVAARARAGWERAGLPALTRWGLFGPAGEPAETPPDDAVQPGGIAYRVAGGKSGRILPLETDERIYDMSLGIAVDTDPEQQVADALAAVRRWIDAPGGPVLMWATLERRTGAGCLPEVPLVGPSVMLALATRVQIADEYRSVRDFEDAFDTVHRSDDLILAGRGEQVLDVGAWLEIAQPSQWALARAARPGGTIYRDPIVLPEEREVFESGDVTMRPAAFDDGVLTYAAWTPPGIHINGWEIYALRDVTIAGALGDGRPVREIRVVFADEDAARRESVPLLDIGVEALYTDAAGTIQPVAYPSS